MLMFTAEKRKDNGESVITYLQHGFKKRPSTKNPDLVELNQSNFDIFKDKIEKED